jgi:hypothetical protein
MLRIAREIQLYMKLPSRTIRPLLKNLRSMGKNSVLIGLSKTKKGKQSNLSNRVWKRIG